MNSLLILLVGEPSSLNIFWRVCQGFESKNMMIDLEQFFKRCPINDRITSLRWADNIRGVPRKKAAGKPPVINFPS